MVEKKEDYKHLRVKKDTHTKVKLIAVKLGMTVDEVINYLSDKENG